MKEPDVVIINQLDYTTKQGTIIYDIGVLLLLQPGRTSLAEAAVKRAAAEMYKVPQVRKWHLASLKTAEPLHENAQLCLEDLASVHLKFLVSHRSHGLCEDIHVQLIELIVTFRVLDKRVFFGDGTMDD